MSQHSLGIELITGLTAGEAALQSVMRYGVGAGLNDIEVGLRLRYELVREFAPYVGVSWLNSFVGTATLRSAGGENRSVFQLVAGFRMWF